MVIKTEDSTSIILHPFRVAWSLLKSIRIWFLLALAIYGAEELFDLSHVLDLPKIAPSAIRSLMVIAGFLQAGIIGNVFMQESVHRYVTYKAARDSNWKTAEGVIQLAFRTAIWALVVLLALDNLGIDITALVTGLGIGGIAAALAINNILGDLFASLSIILDDPFEVGDFIIVGDLMGTVEKIGIKSTRVRSLTGEQIVFANADLLGSRIRNYKRMQERRVVFPLGIIYETPHEKVKTVPEWIRSIVESQENVRFDRCHFKAFGDFSLNFETVYYTLTPDYNIFMDIQQTINQQILAKFADEGVDFAYPTQVEYHRQS